MSITIRRALVTFVALLGLTITTLGAAPAASAAPAATSSVSASVPTVAKFKSCKKLNAKYKGGVAKSKKAKNTKTSHGKKVRAKSKFKPKVSASLYKKNKGLDRDHDGIACER